MGERSHWKPFKKEVATCQACLDLSAENLRWQWRKRSDGKTNAEDRHRVPLAELKNSAKQCCGCHIIHQAALVVLEHLNSHDADISLEYLTNKPLEGLSIRLETNLDAHDQSKEIEDARNKAGFDVSEVFPERRGESSDFYEEGLDAPVLEERPACTVTTPLYEIFLSENEDCHNKPPTWSAVRTRPLRHEDTSSASWALEKLRQCEGHEKCRRRDDGWTLPKRVIDVGDNSKANIRLYETKDGEQAKYVCLSHSWGTPGGGEPLKTTPKTLNEYKIGIKFEDLPKTFQDAVDFTRGLGIRYLWIDSLCIVQGKEGDFVTEAPKMADIYHNAEISLAAADSPNCHGGLFRCKKTRARVCDSTCSRGHPSVYIQELLYINYLVYPRPFDGPYEFRSPKSMSPLIKRAWVLQEFLLSRRVLFFTPLELVWECQECAISESGHTTISHNAKKQLDESVQGQDRIERLRLRWQTIVQIFSYLGLTYKTDALPAIGGLAKRMHAIFGSEYVLGLWKDTFMQNLSWKREIVDSYIWADGLDFEHDDVSLGVPSWSWASQGGPITYNLGPSLAVFGSLEKIIYKSSGDEFTNVSHGLAVLSGYLIPLELRDSGFLQIKPERIVPSGIEIEFDKFLRPDGMKAYMGRTLFVLPLIAIPDRARPEPNTKPVNISFLVLEPIENRKVPHGHIFRRIGIMQLGLFQCLPLRYFIEKDELLIAALERVLRYIEVLKMTRKVRAPLCSAVEQMYYYNMEEDSYHSGHEKCVGMPIREIEEHLGKEKERVAEWNLHQKRNMERKYKRVEVVIQ